MRNNEGLAYIASVHYYIRVLTQTQRRQEKEKTPEMKRKKPYFSYSQMTLLLGGSIDKNIRITKSLSGCKLCININQTFILCKNNIS